jgi:bifunctional non-homologous end joining protein LigD
LPPRSPARYLAEVSRVRFIPPALPKLKASPPVGEGGWLYELKFDGYRVQLTRMAFPRRCTVATAAISRGAFRRLPPPSLGLPTKSCIVDGELIAAGRRGEPDFLALLHGRHVPTCVYCFDLLELNRSDLRELALVQRRAKLQALLTRAKCNLIRFSESFPEGGALLAECARLGLEGIVAKRKDAPYRSGSHSGWIKVKTEEWRAANQWRAEFFEKPTQRQGL